MKSKKFKIFVAVISAVILVCVGSVSAVLIKESVLRHQNNDDYGRFFNHDKVQLVAHRGYSDKAPENTVSAFRQAGECDEFDGIECDVQQTKDGFWVVTHDDTVDRMTNGEGKVREMTYSEIQQLVVDAGVGIEDYPDEKIPTFQQYLTECLMHAKRPFIEIKMDADKEQVQSLYKIICDNGLEDNCTIISFYYDSLKYMREIDSDIEIYALTSKINNKTAQMCLEYNFGMDFSIDEISNTVSKINKMHEKGIPLAVWTVKYRNQYDKMIDNGVKTITCNTPSFPTTVARRVLP